MVKINSKNNEFLIMIDSVFDSVLSELIVFFFELLIFFFIWCRFGK